jgi:chaperone required for assembly of F1-ATPase
MRDILADFTEQLSDPDPVRRAQIQMKKPLPKRFYTKVGYEATDGGHSVLLDGRHVRTPAKKSLTLPTSKAAELVAAEWDAQKDVINPLTMPMTKLANTAIDAISDDPNAVFQDIVTFAGTDLICYRAHTPQALVERQARHWDPILFWLSDVHGARFVLAEGIVHQKQPDAALEAFSKALSRHQDPFRLGCLHVMTTLTGSAILAFAYASRFLSADNVWSAAHVDEDWNMEKWGSDAEAEARRAFRLREFEAASRLFDAVGD